MIKIGYKINAPHIKNRKPFLTPLGLLFLFVYFDQCKKKKTEDHSMYIPTKFGSNWPSAPEEED